MPSVCRVGDIGVGVCPNHLSPVTYTTTINSGAASVLTNGKITATKVSIGISTCGHPTIVLTTSGKKLAEGSGIHRLGDTGQNFGPYSMVTGSPNVNAAN